MNNKYKLSGFINLFNIIPDFVIPLFLEEDDDSHYFAQYGNDDNLSFEKFPLCQYDKTLYYELSNPNIYFRDLNPFNSIREFKAKRISRRYPYKYEFIDQSMAIYAFHNGKEIVYGELPFFLNYINNFITEDNYLIEQINDFKEYTKSFVEIYKKESLKNSNNNKFYTFDLSVPDNSLYSSKHLPIFHKTRLLPIFNNQDIITANLHYVHAISNRAISNNSMFNNYNLIEYYDKELRKYHFDSVEYKRIIEILYLLLYNNENNSKNEKKDFKSNFLNNFDIILRNKNND